MASGYPRSFIGSYTGDGVDARKIDVPFRANVIEIFNMTTAGRLVQTVTMPADGGLRHVTGGLTIITANGVTIQDDGFLVGTDTAVNNSGDKYHFIARQ